MPRSHKTFPKSLKIGEHHYEVVVKKRATRRATVMGQVDYRTKVIAVSTFSGLTGLPYKPRSVHDTFWHEVTHGILYEMGNSLYRNEAFVSRFASLLADAIETARFE